MLKKLLSLAFFVLTVLPGHAAITNCIIGSDTSAVFGTADFGPLNPLSLPASPISTTLAYFGECTRTATTDPRRVQLRITVGPMSTDPSLAVASNYSTMLITLDWPTNWSLGVRRVEGTATYTLTGASATTTPGLRTFSQSTTTQVRTCPNNNNSGCSAYGGDRVEVAYVDVELVKSCQISPATLNFGTVVPSSTANRDATASVGVACTSTTPYSVTFSGGNPAPGGVRSMVRSGNTDTLLYQAYSDAGRTAALSATSGYGGTGVGASQAYTVHGRVFPNQFPPAGGYSDTLTMTVTY